MKCDKCGKEFQTYSGTCPYCHNKHRKLSVDTPKIEYVPTRKPDLSVPPQPIHSGETSTSNYSLQDPHLILIWLIASVITGLILKNALRSGNLGQIAFAGFLALCCMTIISIVITRTEASSRHHNNPITTLDQKALAGVALIVTAIPVYFGYSFGS